MRKQWSPVSIVIESQVDSSGRGGKLMTVTAISMEHAGDLLKAFFSGLGDAEIPLEMKVTVTTYVR